MSVNDEGVIFVGKGFQIFTAGKLLSFDNQVK